MALHLLKLAITLTLCLFVLWPFFYIPNKTVKELVGTTMSLLLGCALGAGIVAGCVFVLDFVFSILKF